MDHFRSALHECLRGACKAPHRTLDHHPLLMPLLREGLTLEGYGDALVALHGVFDALELRLHTHVLLPFPYAVCPKLPALNADLAELKRHPLTTSVEWPMPGNLSQLVGMLYTLEGSGMGGQAIARHLRQSSAAAYPLRFFGGNGEDPMLRWQQFWMFADALCPASCHVEAAASAAALFGSIKLHLDAAFSLLHPIVSVGAASTTADTC